MEMMPTRLQDGLSISLLQWMRTVESSESRTVIVRINDTESLHQVMHLLENAGLTEIEPMTASTLRGRVTAEALSRVVRCLGVCSVTPENPE
jgi:hypothetical protein